MTDSERIERLEYLVRRLAQQVGELRGEVAQLRGERAPLAVELPEEAAPAEAAAPRAPRPRFRTVPPADEPAAAVVNTVDSPTAAARTAPPPRRPLLDVGDRSDLEGLVGRYGTVALAALTIIVGVGAFLQWAIERITIGPAMRVGLGLLAAAGVAALGLRLRSRGARQYGNTLIGLALAIVHVDAWGAGPQLQVIPSSVALAIAAAASVAVAALAFREQEQSLFAVGTGGALLAPFVTSNHSGRVVALLVYGLVVLTTGFRALRSRAWTLARTIMLVGGVAYVLAALAAMPVGAAAAVRTSPALFTLACAWGALALSGEEHARPLARSYLGALLSALMWDVSGYAEGPAERIVPLALLGTLTAYASLRLANRASAHAGYGDELVEGVLLPLALLAAALASLAGAFTLQGAGLALLWCALAVGAWALLVRADESGGAAPTVERRPVYLLTAGAASALAIVLALHDHDVVCVIALSAHAVLFAAIARRTQAVEPAIPAAGALVVAAVWSFGLMSERTPYEYTPFLTTASLAALAASAGWALWAWQVLGGAKEGEGRHAGRGLPWPVSGNRTAIALFGVVPAFLWAREELAHAISAETSTFLLILYYAVTGVGAIFVGRRYGTADARKVGLALAVYAALKALAQASGLSNIGLRVGSYLLVGGFLLGVAYWYRAANEKQVLKAGY